MQGVGFRPFVYRLACRTGIHGWVQNRRGGVWIHAEGKAGDIDSFVHTLLTQAPAIARPTLLSRASVATEAARKFEIRHAAPLSSAQPVRQTDIHVPVDYGLCADCLSEMNDPADRRYRYPFINCTQCGPRHTLIHALPYDRKNTSMAGFTLCARCKGEYRDTTDRRFHAQPIACRDCGPGLVFCQNGRLTHGNEPALQQTLGLLRQGGIVAIKGIGGYHLMCDARSDKAVHTLRQRKYRPDKPLAVMFPSRGSDELELLRQYVRVTDKAAALLQSPQRPIVLLDKCTTEAGSAMPLSHAIAPAVGELGVFLPYSPLHTLLLNDFEAPLVATSANISGEPVIADNQEAEQGLAQVADAFLHHDRPIVQPADDSVYRIIHRRPRPLRIGRGMAPLERVLPMAIDTPMLAVGGQMKNTMALAWGQRLVIASHIGDLDSPRSLERFQQTFDRLQDLYGVRAGIIVSDAHPDYRSHRQARQKASQEGLIWQTVFHHHAHAASVVLEHETEQENRDMPWLVFTWDGSGYAEDGTLWGGEALLGRPGHWHRVASFKPFYLPGGDKAARQAWRCAAALCWQAGVAYSRVPEHELLKQAWEKRVNCPVSSSVGRLFDAACALTGLLDEYSFEGQGPMWLESRITEDSTEKSLPLSVIDKGILTADWSVLLDMLQDDSLSIAQRASKFHGRLAATLVEQACRLRETHGEFRLGLSGGVFQNRRLSEQVMKLLQEQGFDAHVNRQIPCNDAGLCAGQILEAAARMKDE